MSLKQIRITSWLADDIAYFDPVLDLDFESIRRADCIDVDGINQSKGLILDLRHCHEPDWNVLTERGRYHAVYGLVSACLTDSLAWARRVPNEEEARSWLTIHARQKRVEVPIVVLVGPETNGAAAMAAEVLSRTRSATLLGEPTAPLPFCRMRYFIDINTYQGARRCVLFPSSIWESEDGSVLTGKIVEPDIPWPAEDIEGLVVRAKEVILSTF